jgi:shikimate dehydrogenase
MNMKPENRPRGMEVYVTANTRICGIIGDPVEHSISPQMHNAAFRKLDLDFVYLPFRVKREDLNQAIEGLRALNARGLNVTIPHKVAVIPFLDEVDALAREIGAVNTIVNEEGMLKGYNTDASGFLKALQAGHIKVENKNILILGAGGACRAIAFVLADRGAAITLMNRHPAPAADLAGWLFQKFRRKIDVLELSPENMENCLKQADILVNTTSVGMAPGSNETLVPEGLLRKALSVIDIIYNPVRTRLLKAAEKQGAIVMSGLEMLVWQGAAAFEIWTGEKAPVDEMRRTAGTALEGYED